VAILPVIIDSRPEYLDGDESARSVLLMPLGMGTTLSHLASRVTEVEADRLCILPPAGARDEYRRMIQTASDGSADVLEPGELTDRLNGYEPADLLLMLDARYWPVEGFDLAAIVRKCNGSPWALHAVAARSNLEGIQEFVRCDERGYVRRVRRYYDRVTWPETGAIPYSLVPVSAAENLSFSSLAGLRSTLVDRGMLSQDVPLCSGIADLSIERNLLALAERHVIRTVTGPVPSGCTSMASEVLVGPGSDIHPSARIVGPVLIQNGATVGQDVTIIGPAVLGTGASVLDGAEVLQSVVAADATVAEDASVRHRVVGGAQSQDCKKERLPDSGPLPTSPFHPREGNDLQEEGRPTPETSVSRRWYRRTKLVIDTVVAAAGLVVLSPVMVVVAILIKLDSSGPVLFGHEREGKGGQVFKCWKFRTMCADAHRKQREMYDTNLVDGPQFKLDSDPRITRIGAWLRATNLDEIPQLINVLLGQMSVVGPRPSPFRENQICIPWRRARLSVRPGITGLWQVCRHNRSQGDFHQWIAYDTRYVINASLLVDLKIVLATLFTLGGRLGAPEHWIIKATSLRTHLSRRHTPLTAGPPSTVVAGNPS